MKLYVKSLSKHLNLDESKENKTLIESSISTQNGKFYEKNEVNNIADVYNYEVKEKIVVDYKSIELNGEKNSTYFFTDYKIDLD
jgi:hypothetical protein